ncbi:MAG: HAD family hydrolase [Gemmatimonadota bacterium]
MIRLVVFDWGGVLTAGEYDRHVARLLAERSGHPEEDLYRAWRAGKRLALERGDASPEEAWEELVAGFDLRGGVEEFAWLLRGAVVPEPGVIDLLRPLRSRAVLALLSNNYPVTAGIARKSIGAYFDKLFFSNETGHVKPHPDAYVEVLDALGVAPAEALFVDDKERNLGPARELGMAVHLFRHAPELRADLVGRGLLVA